MKIAWYMIIVISYFDKSSNASYSQITSLFIFRCTSRVALETLREKR